MPEQKDWRGNSNSIYKTLGASNHTDKEREKDDYYATDPNALITLLNRVSEKDVEPILSKNIWECACGGGHLSNTLKQLGYNVHSSDIVNRGCEDYHYCDFLSNECERPFKDEMTILTNPPYKFAEDFAYKGLDLLNDGEWLLLFLKVQFLEGKSRYELFKKFPPKYIFVHSSRQLCAKNGEFQKMRDNGGSAVAYAWYCWKKDYNGDTIVKWIK